MSSRLTAAANDFCLSFFFTLAGFMPIMRETLSSQIREQLLERIVSGVMEPGAKVPSERALSEQFGVERADVDAECLAEQVLVADAAELALMQAQRGDQQFHFIHQLQVVIILAIPLQQREFGIVHAPLFILAKRVANLKY